LMTVLATYSALADTIRGALAHWPYYVRMLRNAFFPFGGDFFQIIFAADARNGALLR
jgi:hypothetical protein